MKDLDRHTWKVIIKKLKEAGWDNANAIHNGLPIIARDTPVNWIDAELSHRVKDKKVK